MPSYARENLSGQNFEADEEGGHACDRMVHAIPWKNAPTEFSSKDPPDGCGLSTPLEAYAQPSAKVVSSENVGGRQVFRLQYRFLVPLSKETLLAALWKMGAVTADDLQGGLEWREWL